MIISKDYLYRLSVFTSLCSIIQFIRPSHFSMSAWWMSMAKLYYTNYFLPSVFSCPVYSFSVCVYVHGYSITLFPADYVQLDARGGFPSVHHASPSLQDKPQFQEILGIWMGYVQANVFINDEMSSIYNVVIVSIISYDCKVRILFRFAFGDCGNIGRDFSRRIWHQNSVSS